MRRRLLVAVLVALAGAVRAQQEVPEPREYRMDNYRAPVPAALSGARVITTEEAETIWRDKQGVFIDVLPRAAKAAKSSRRHGLARQAALQHSRQPLAARHRLWKTCRGDRRLFPAGLARASGGNKAALLVIYCQENCWMSWNAAKRALSYGYTNVAWFPEGTEGWERAPCRPMENRNPQPRRRAEDRSGIAALDAGSAASRAVDRRRSSRDQPRPDDAVLARGDGRRSTASASRVS